MSLTDKSSEKRLEARDHNRVFRYFDFVMAAFVTVLLCSNLIGATKAVSLSVGWLPFVSDSATIKFTAGVLFFPISYIFGDILTEVYGYARARRVVWTGFAALLFMSFMSAVVVAMPPAADWHDQEAYRKIFGLAPRIALASLVAFWAGELTNSYVLAKMKVWMEGRHLWMRTIGSTIAGEGVDSLIFYPLAFLGAWDTSLVFQVMVTNYAIKTAWEIVITPVTYRIVGFLKRAEQEDYYDRDTNFTPFSVKA